MSHPSGISKDVVRAGPATLHSHLQLRRCWKGQEGAGDEEGRLGRVVGVLRVPPYQEKLGCQHFPEARGGGSSARPLGELDMRPLRAWAAGAQQ